MVIYGLAMICGIFLFFRYRNNFYLWRYLVKSNNKFEKLDGKIEKIEKEKSILKKGLIIIYLVVIIIICFFILKFKDEINKNMSIIMITFFYLVAIISVDIIILYASSFKKTICKLIKISKKDFMEIIILILLSFFGINTFNWFQKFNPALSIFFIEFLFVICILCFLKLLFILKKFKSILLFISFLLLFFGIIYYASKENTNAIRITKGKLEDLKGGSIELFLENNKKPFPIKIDDNKKLYIENNDSLFENYNIIKPLFNKENNLSLVTENISKLRLSWELLSPIPYNEIKQGKFLFVNNENSRILDRNGNDVNDKIRIEGKIIVIENNPNNYIFIGNDLGWTYLNKNKKIGIKKDNFAINVLNLTLFLFCIMYFWLKLYGKKSKEYYDYKTIYKIKDTKILFVKDKYDKFLTLSAFGLTISKIWEIATIKDIGEMNKQVSYFLFLFEFAWFPTILGIILFCIITSKEISECVKELENKRPKRKRKNWQTNHCKKKGE